MERRFDVHYDRQSPAYPFDLGIGPTAWRCVIVDRKTGRRFQGWGDTKEEAYERALERFERSL
jgi:hypothetical protein